MRSEAAKFAAVFGGVIVLAVVTTFLFSGAPPAIHPRPLPNPNGYDTLAAAGQLVNGNPGLASRLTPAQLKELVVTNAAALQAARIGLQQECQVPLVFGPASPTNYTHTVIAFRQLSDVMTAEGRLAEIENRPADAAKSYLDAIRLGNQCARGGLLIHAMIGTAIERSGTEHLNNLVGQLDARTARDAARTLETLDANRQSWSDVLQQEKTWRDQAFRGWRYRWSALFMANTLKQNQDKAEKTFQNKVAKARNLELALAARAYELDQGKHPASAADLVPNYLKAVPTDPVGGTNLVLVP